MRNDIIDFDVIDETGPQTYRGTYETSVSDLERDEVSGMGSIDLEVRVDVGDLEDEYVADGTVRFTADLSCSRCAEPYPFANTSPFHVRFRPRPAASTENEEVEITDEEELDVEFYSDRTIPLRDFAIEQVQLAIPMKPLCDENCLGLCPNCGVNRTREACACETSVTDERWGTLKDLRAELAKKKDI
jgi:uncharacterized protein